MTLVSVKRGMVHSGQHALPQNEYTGLTDKEGLMLFAANSTDSCISYGCIRRLTPT